MGAIVEKSEGSEGEEHGVGKEKRRKIRLEERTSEREKHIFSGVLDGYLVVFIT